MARTLILDTVQKEFSKALARSFQSGHINFLFGSGASLPGIPVAGQIEKAIADLLEAGNESGAQLKMYEFLTSIQVPTNKLIEQTNDPQNTETVQHYAEFLKIVESLLSERRTTLLPKQATIFTANYDLFLEQASVSFPALQLNDGFSRTPSLDGRMVYSSRNFFNTVYNSGNLYSYKVEIPSINLVKLHGSLSWKKSKDDMMFSVAIRNLLPSTATAGEIAAFIEDYAVVLPLASKFRTTLMDRSYYELLRIYANALDRENALLICFGFSFGDDHIQDITKRALKNPTLRVAAFAHCESDITSLAAMFDGNNNVDIVGPATGGAIDFKRFNDVLRSAVPMAEKAP